MACSGFLPASVVMSSTRPFAPPAGWAAVTRVALSAAPRRRPTPYAKLKSEDYAQVFISLGACLDRSDFAQVLFSSGFTKSLHSPVLRFVVDGGPEHVADLEAL